MNLTGLALFLGPFAVFLHTMTGCFGVDDSPETISAMAMLEHQHPPGYPLFTLLGRLAIMVPVGGPGFRIALLAAVGAALAAAITGSITRRLARSAGMDDRQSTLAGVMGTVFCAFSWTFWGQALTAKGGAYTLNAVVLAGILLLLVSGTKGKPRAGSVAMLAGLGLAHHWMSFLAAAPGLAVMWGLQFRLVRHANYVGGPDGSASPFQGGRDLAPKGRTRPAGIPGARKLSIAVVIALLGVSKTLLSTTPTA